LGRVIVFGLVADWILLAYSCTILRGRGGGLICGLDFAVCVVVEWEERQDLFNFLKFIFLAVKW
jgi:hypothetical protein